MCVLAGRGEALGRHFRQLVQKDGGISFATANLSIVSGFADYTIAATSDSMCWEKRAASAIHRVPSLSGPDCIAELGESVACSSPV